MEENFLTVLKNPPAKFRGMPFWSWNGLLEESELLKQIDVIKDMGFGGFFMHSRTGLITEYLGDEWFRLIRKCALYAADLGLEVWLYDEDRWPSGTCGGLVTANEDYRMRYVSEYDSDEDALSNAHVKKILARVAIKFDSEGKYTDIIDVASKSEVPSGYSYLVYAEELQGPSDFYNGYTYVDTMNRAATDAFLESTHELYAKVCGDLLGKEIKGIFVDEPHRGAMFNGFSVVNDNRSRMMPYTGKLQEAYREKFGEEVNFAKVFYFESGQHESEFSYKYVDILDDLFLQNFAVPYQEWCHKHNVLVTGHILHEESLSIQTSLSGSMMRYYEYMDIPGVDNLCANSNSYWAAKQCSSVARQMGKDFVLSELYGCTGWDMTLSEFKRIGDWHVFCGINFRCPHLSWYTMKGEAKRDYPTSILHQNAWYKDWSLLETYFGRIGMLMTEGTGKINTLVVHPVEEMWRLVKKGWMNVFSANDEKIIQLDNAFFEQCLELMDKNIAFDYGDEELMQKYGVVDSDEDGAYIKVGEAVYREILVQNIAHLRESTAEMLRLFEENGGKVCRNISDLSDVSKIETPDGVTALIKYYQGEDWLVCLNLKKEKVNGKIRLSDNFSDAELEEWDLAALKLRGYADLNNIEFLPNEMRVFKLSKKAKSVDKVNSESLVLPSKMRYTLSESNACVLDYAKYYVDGVLQNDGNKIEVLKIDNTIRDSLGLTRRGGEMIQPWFSKKLALKTADASCKVKLVFDVVSDIDCPVRLAVEEVDSILFNGKEVQKTDEYWVDSCFDVYQAELKKGENIIEIGIDYSIMSNIEAIYILGDFGVILPQHITEKPAYLTADDIAKQGFPFYTGAISYFTGIDKGNVSIDLPALNCTTLHILGGDADEVLAFAPYKTIVKLKNELVLKAYFTRRNLFGPFHLLPQPQDGYGPYSWKSEGENWTDEYILQKNGLKIK